MKKLSYILVLLLGASLVMCNRQPAVRTNAVVEDTLKASTPQEAIAKLLAGNERFVNEKSIYPHCNVERVNETSAHQAPFAAVVGCSDSRVAALPARYPEVRKSMAV